MLSAAEQVLLQLVAPPVPPVPDVLVPLFPIPPFPVEPEPAEPEPAEPELPMSDPLAAAPDCPKSPSWKRGSSGRHPPTDTDSDSVVATTRLRSVTVGQ